MPRSEVLARRGLTALFAVNVAAATAAAIVLAFFPRLIPNLAGVAIGPSQYLLAYLLAAAELAIALLAALAIRLRIAHVELTAAAVLIAFHAASALAGLAALAQGAGLVVGLNVAARVAMVAALAVCASMTRRDADA